MFLRNRLQPKKNAREQENAVLKIQTLWRGFAVRKSFFHEMSLLRMERTFRFFDKI